MIQLIHLFVENLDQYFGNVCELDIVFNFHKVYGILDEIIVGGEVLETAKDIIVNSIKNLEIEDWSRHIVSLSQIMIIMDGSDVRRRDAWGCRGVVFLVVVLEEVAFLHEEGRPEEEDSSETVDSHCWDQVAGVEGAAVEYKSADEIHQSSKASEQVHVKAALVLLNSLCRAFLFLFDHSVDLPALSDHYHSRSDNEKPASKPSQVKYRYEQIRPDQVKGRPEHRNQEVDG